MDMVAGIDAWVVVTDSETHLQGIASRIQYRPEPYERRYLNPPPTVVGEYLLECEEDRTVRAVFGMLREVAP